MLMTTTDTFEGETIDQYLGIVTGETVMGGDTAKRAQARFQRLRQGELPAIQDIMTKRAETFTNEFRSVTEACSP